MTTKPKTRKAPGGKVQGERHILHIGQILDRRPVL
jgi:hypothetical protein